ncbi:alpha-1,2-fucosyltransferase [Mycolicibacterium frederiksbergense]|nr:alpha-1,2-fucosyltransferase [Mycolicibacterium frederiksbergense]MDO0972830.1 alpha-1,2-fucosyltransferase [Mycolicibacterium frederiksbergense]
MLWRTIGLAPAKLRDYAASNLTISPPRYTCETIGERDCGQRLEAGNHLWARGYFQDPTTFESDRARIREVLRTALEESTPVNSWKLGYEYSAIHVRRGDYIAVQKITERLGVCTLDYFIAAAEDLDPSLPVKVVSDDPDWCAEVLSPAVAAETTTISTGSDLADLLVLMGAREMVLSNSTFSWWGAFAGDAKRVIAPSVWFDAPDAGGLGLTAIADVLRDKVTGRLAGPG